MREIKERSFDQNDEDFVLGILEKNKLTQKQAKFIFEYIKCGNYGIAVSRSYNSTNRQLGYTLSINPKIQGIIKEISLYFDTKMIMDAKETLETITKIARDEDTEDVVCNSLKNGERIKTVKRVSAKERLKALELMLRVHKLFDSKLDNPDDNITIVDDIEE